MECNALKDLFYKDLKKYNENNFKRLRKSDLNNPSPDVYKCFSSVVTRYFIFAEKHPEISEPDLNLLYFLLRIDTVARFFSKYPAVDVTDLALFQDELRNFVDEHWGSDQDDGDPTDCTEPIHDPELVAVC